MVQMLVKPSHFQIQAKKRYFAFGLLFFLGKKGINAGFETKSGFT